MGPEMLVEGVERPFLVWLLKGLHFVQKVGVGPDGTLTKDDQVPGYDVGPFDGDPDRDGPVDRLKVVQRAVDHRLTRMHVHRVVDRVAHPVCGMVFHDGRDNSQLMSFVQRRRCQPSSGVDDVGA